MYLENYIDLRENDQIDTLSGHEECKVCLNYRTFEG